MKKLISPILIALFGISGTICLTLAAFLAWMRSLDYIWFISGPYPFSIGGGLEGAYYFIGLVILGVILYGFAIVTIIVNSIRKGSD